MVSTDVSERFFASAPARWAGTARALMLLLLLVAPAFLAIYQQLPPAPVAADAPREDFSSARALSHLQAIAQEPHPIGSEESAAVRDYIYGELRAQGLDPQVQAALAVGADRANQHRAGMVRNVVARLKGTGGGKAVLLTAHYDSVPTGPGANDDGVGVATLLETARALRAASPLRNDVIFLFTDGEEAGLLGARAFADEHPWAKEVGVALNFEARGNGGPAVMFETSDGNDWMIKEFAAAAPAPVANSLSYEIYKRMPNDTDLSVFKKGGVPGMNFAYIDGLTHYHTGADDLQSVSESSLQHQGSYSLSLARRFGGLSLNGGNSANAIYFNLPGPLFVHYGGALVLPLAGSAALLYALFVFLGFRRGMLTAKGFALGVVALPTSCVAASLAVTTAWSLTRPLLKVFESMPWGEPRGVGFYVIALVLITVAVFAALYNLFLRRARVADLTAGALLWWALLTLAAGVMMPGASYLLVWPLLCALAGMVILFARGEQESPVHWGALALVAVPAVALFGPLIDQVFTALTLNAGGKVAVLLVLLCGLLIPHFRMLAGTKEWALPAGAAILGGAFLAAGLTTASVRGGPRMNSVFYGLNADTGRALWGSDNDAPDGWTAQFFPSGSGQQRMLEFFPAARETFLTGVAPAAPLAAPEVALLEDARDGQTRTLRLRVTSPRKAPVVSIYANVDGELIQADLDGREMPVKSDAQQPWALHYYAFPEGGAELTLRVKSSGPVELRVNDRSYGLPADIPFKKRPGGMMPSPSRYSEATFVCKSFRL